jgi:peptidoglycan/LPS O-acetylase OafA/YrhL
MFLINLVIINYAIRLFTSATAVHGPFNVNGDGSLGTFLALTAVVLPLTVLYGYISGRYLEQPIRRWAHRFGRRDQAATARPATAKAPAGS